MRDPMWIDDANVPSTSNPLLSVNEVVSGHSNPRYSSGKNVFNLLTRREIAPRTKRSTKRLWRQSSKDGFGASCHIFEAGRDARSGLISWVEAESLHHLTAKYCPLLPPPRSTIAAAFSPDGKMLASTHGDHTVKIIDCQSGNCLKVLSGHRRTPWVVRYHPTNPGLIASGSLDHEVRLWDANTSECIGSRDFHRPIASIAFHSQGELLAVASGHKLYIWNYNERGELSIPTVVLKTRRSLRAVHFHPHASPFLVTAEVNDLDSSDSSMTQATSQHFVQYPPPTLYIANVNASDWSEELPLPFSIWPPLTRSEDRISFQPSERVGPSSVRLLTYSTPSGQYELLLSPIESGNSPSLPDEIRHDRSSAIDAMETSEAHSRERSTQILSLGDSAYCDLPFLQGWFFGQSQAGQRMVTQDDGDPQPRVSRFQSELATSLAELPCTVKLRIWKYDVKDPSAPLEVDKCRVTISHAVLCSEMGAHFSPCGRFLAACVACMLPQAEGESGIQIPAHHDTIGASTSPTRHPIPSQPVMYELRIYSLEESTFGLVLASRAIRAAHCLTSIQFSPTSEHLLLAYGRRHNSLLKSIFFDGETSVPIYTILEVYRVSDMKLVKVLPSAEDEVNVACFHPSVGSGLVYGTKEGKLRILQYDIFNSLSGATCFPDENFLEVPSHALEC